MSAQGEIPTMVSGLANQTRSSFFSHLTYSMTKLIWFKGYQLLLGTSACCCYPLAKMVIHGK